MCELDLNVCVKEALKTNIEKKLKKNVKVYDVVHFVKTFIEFYTVDSLHSFKLNEFCSKQYVFVYFNCIVIIIPLKNETVHLKTLYQTFRVSI